MSFVCTSVGSCIGLRGLPTEEDSTTPVAETLDTTVALRQRQPLVQTRTHSLQNRASNRWPCSTKWKARTHLKEEWWQIKNIRWWSLRKCLERKANTGKNFTLLIFHLWLKTHSKKLRWILVLCPSPIITVVYANPFCPWPIYHFPYLDVIANND